MQFVVSHFPPEFYDWCAEHGVNVGRAPMAFAIVTNPPDPVLFALRWADHIIVQTDG